MEIARGRSEYTEFENHTPADNYINFKWAESRPTVSAATMAGGTILDPECRRTMAPEKLEERWLATDKAMQTLSPKLYSIMFACLTANKPESLAKIFSCFNATEVARYFLSNTFSKKKSKDFLKGLPDPTRAEKLPGQPAERPNPLWHQIKQKCFGKKLSNDFVAGVAEFLKLLPAAPGEEQILACLAAHNKTVRQRDRLSIPMLRQIFSAYNFVALQERTSRKGYDGDPSGDLAKLFGTTVEYSSTRFHPTRLGNGRLVNENQAAIAINQVFLDLSLEKISAKEWHVLAGLMQEQLLRLGNSNTLDIHVEQLPVAIEFLRRVFQEIQKNCAQNPDGNALAIINRTLTDVISATHHEIRLQVRDRYNAKGEPQIDPAIAPDRAFSPQADLAKRIKEDNCKRKIIESDDFLWSMVGQWMPRFMDSGGCSIKPSVINIHKHDEAEKVRQNFDAFFAHFADPETAARENRKVDIVPVQHWAQDLQVFERNFYAMPAIAWQFMKIACGAPKADASIMQIWARLQTSSDLNDPDGKKFARLMFDLSLEELRKDAGFADKDTCLGAIALNLLSLEDNGNRMDWPEFQDRVLKVMQPYDKRTEFGPQFDAEYHEANENARAVDAGVTGSLKSRDKYIRTAGSSNADPSESGDAELGIEIPAAAKLAAVYKSMQREMRNAEITPPDAAKTQEIGAEIVNVLTTMSRRKGMRTAQSV